MKKHWLMIFPAILGLGLTAACSNSSSTTGPTEGSGDIYPMYVDANRDGVNDYVQAATHDPGTPAGHAFVDADRDGICDRAEDGGVTWHGPGFVDTNGNGICDRWESGMPMFRQPGDMQFRDDNGNGANDYAENPWHGQPGHAFVDADHDGICDRAENGSPSWHGPGFVDTNRDGTCDYWQSGGMGYGGPGSHGPMGGGMHR